MLDPCLRKDDQMLARGRPVTNTRRRLAAGVAVGALTLAACGGGSDSSGPAAGAEPGVTLPTVGSVATSADRPAATTPADEGPGSPAPVTPPAAAASGLVDLVGPDVAPAADIATNQLPDVVLDDVSNGREVNFRNLVPQDKPILLWMWAPH